MAMNVKTKKGRKFYTPAAKGEKYAFELKNNYNASTGETLSKNARAYRSGYLDARSDNAKAYKYNLKKRGK